MSAHALYNKPHALSSYNLSFIYECIVCTIGVLYSPFQRQHKLYSIQEKIFNSCNNLIPFKYAIGINGESMSHERPYQMLVDSGLLILSNWKPNEYGFVSFSYQPLHWYEWSDEIFANKGMLYGYWKTNNIGTIVINTHLTTQSRNKKYMELNELEKLINKLKNKYVNDSKYLEIYVVGDFNIEYSDEHLNEIMIHRLKFKRLTKYIQNELQGNIDHIFEWNNFENSDNDVEVFQETINPPVFIQNEYKKKYLSDHVERDSTSVINAFYRILCINHFFFF
eukprot:206375_1